MAEQDLAMQVLQQVVKLPVVKVDRSKFLVDKFSKELGPQDIPTLLEQGPTSLLSQEILDRVANACIRDNVLLASGTSVLAGLPGGLAMAITIPADVAQFYTFSLKLAQELGYIYGYEDLWASREELSEDAQNTLLLYLGVMLGVNGTAALLRAGGITIAKQVMKTVPNKALTKTLWYPILKKSLKNIWCESYQGRAGQRNREIYSYLGWYHFRWFNLCNYETNGGKLAERIIQASQL
ncbi:ABC transporter ATPase [Streptococcus pneumoniae]|nr:ABC transporter ATPase [Streptococcus pneumoniae]VRR02046.1 ABC transporter ATPase [Streptococcus pneumoniae]